MITHPGHRPRVVAVLVGLVGLVGLAGTRAAAAPPPAFHAEPQVAVVELAAGATATTTIVLHNDGAANVVAGSITPEAGCDAAMVHASPLTGFTLIPGASRSIAVTCSPAPPSMQRCGYQVRSPDGTAVLELEAVCAYAGTASLTTDVAAIDFGSVAIGGRASRTIALRDAAALDQLFIELTDLAGDFAVAAPCNPDARECDAAIRAVAADTPTSLVVTCTPRDLGPLTAQLHVTTGAGTQLAAPIAVACTGAPPTGPVIAVAPSAIDVGSVELRGATATTTVHITNVGTDSLKLVDVQIVDGGTGGASDWTSSPRTPCDAAVSSTCAVASHETFDLDLAFQPSAIGRRDATLLINYRDTADRSTSVPLHGIGRGATLDLVAGTTVLDFGALPLGATGALTFQVANRGIRDLSDGALAISPAGPPFTVSPGPSFAVSTAAPTTITVTCTPTAGAAAAVLQLAAADVSSPPIDVTLRCTGDPAMTLTATPPAILLGEVRIATPSVRHVTIAGLHDPDQPVSLASATLELADLGLTVTSVPPLTPATLDLSVDLPAEARLINRLIVAQPSVPPFPPPLAIPVIGTAVAARYTTPNVVSLGTFCVGQPTTPRILPLTSTGTATIALSAPALQSADSPFDLELVAPLGYPAMLAPQLRALVAVTPKRQAVAGFASDDLVWTTDVADSTVAHTRLTATFVDDGGAIAPPALTFSAAVIHVDLQNAQPVTLQNCSGSLLQLDRPLISAPFSIDSPSFPDALRPGETATFSVGFHPTKLGTASSALVITSPQLGNVPLMVALSGEGVVGDGGADGSDSSTDLGRTSFYACGSCASSDPSGAIAITLAALCAVVPRRRAGRAGRGFRAE